MNRTMAGSGVWVVLLVFLCLASLPASAQFGGGTYALKEGERNLKFAGIPVPGYSDVLGVNLGLVGMAFYKMDRNDPALPPSATGLFGFYSANNSWMGAAFQKFHLAHDDWRILAALGTGSIKYQFNPAAIGPGLPDVFIDYSTATGFLFAQGSRRTWGNLYLGLGVVAWKAQVSLEPDVIEAPDENFVGPGVTAEFDMRNHQMYPTDGYMVQGRYLIYRDAFGSDRDFQGLNWTVAGYHALGDSSRVLAGRVLNQGAFGDVPFSAEAIVNGNRNLRGYSNGRFRANQLLMVEAEYRWMFHRRWGAVAFAGLGWSADEVATMSLGETLSAAGFGVRFRIIESYKVNARIDVGWGQDDRAIYFAIGEAY